MPRFAANVDWMFRELPFLERFEAAAGAGFEGARVDPRCLIRRKILTLRRLFLTSRCRSSYVPIMVDIRPRGMGLFRRHAEFASESMAPFEHKPSTTLKQGGNHGRFPVSKNDPVLGGVYSAESIKVPLICLSRLMFIEERGCP